MARRYMIRLEQSDMEGEALRKLASAAKLTPDDFKKRFMIAVG
jgi:ATP-dependent phosphofructokinase / diphosphate-dependent phosphofructokinase